MTTQLLNFEEVLLKTLRDVTNYNDTSSTSDSDSLKSSCMEDDMDSLSTFSSLSSTHDIDFDSYDTDFYYDDFHKNGDDDADSITLETEALSELTEQLRTEIEEAELSFVQSNENEHKNEKTMHKLFSLSLMPLLEKIAFLRCNTDIVTCNNFMIV
uniref:Uncharacterized protein n=1 Tax=Ditylum brightwellii TaxID=49249 RepID=A0A7S4SQH3_9STRA|mmetsp:Transcript_3917/g.5197  ORF Transcript_3917/g.5197 Transcript_3917/m.5197 type:complete len:156 (+) Transcript_3917:51-518(+)